MPLPARSVSPVDIAQGRIPPGLQQGDDLECVANGTMANLMRQMSSLGLHAVQIFGDIHKEVSAQDRRIERIHDRLSRLQENLANQENFFPPQTTNAELDGRRKAFKSAMVIDQHTLDRSTMPPAMLELYNKCEDPPNLDLLNPYRDDSKSALKLYTNPEYFFDLWKEEMLKGDPMVKTARSARSPDRSGSPTKKRKQRTSTSATRNQNHGNSPIQSNVVLGHYQQQQQRMQQQNEQFMHFPSEYQAPELLRSNNISINNDNHQMPPPPGMSVPPHSSNQPTRIAPGRPTSTSQHQQQSREMVSNFQGLNLTHSNDLGLIDEDDDELPPPPPPLSDHTSLLPNLGSPSAYSSSSTMPLMTVLTGSPMKLIEAPPAAPPPNDNDILPPPPLLSSTVMGSAPPPPPPPPPPPLASMTLMTSSTLIQATSFGGSNSGNAGNLSSDSAAVKEGGGLNINRGNLLAEIQAGMKLRKTQIQKEKEEEAAAVEKNDVAAILRQRMKKVTTSISDDEDEDDDGEWD